MLLKRYQKKTNGRNKKDDNDWHLLYRLRLFLSTYISLCREINEERWSHVAAVTSTDWTNIPVISMGEGEREQKGNIKIGKNGKD